MVEEFSKHGKAVQAQNQVGNIYFYDIYDYTNSGGWGAFVAVLQKFPDTFKSERITVMLKKTEILLTEIKQLQDEIQRNKSKKAQLFEEMVRCYQQIAKNWEDLHNYPKAIETYKALIKDFPDKNFAVADAYYKDARLYQKNGQYEKAIQSYDNLINNIAESKWHNEAIYQRSICLRILGVSE